jgi:drug/metabolite transporter (DMT)-like permease
LNKIKFNKISLSRILNFQYQASINQKKIFGASLIFIGAICFSTKAILVKLAYQFPIDSVSLLSLRMLFSLPFYMLIGFLSGVKEGNFQMSRKDWAKLSGLGFIGYTASLILKD